MTCRFSAMAPHRWPLYRELSVADACPVTVEFETTDGSALDGHRLHPRLRGTLTFAPGQTTRTILVQTVDDSAMEPNETFSVVLSNPQGAVHHSTAQAVGTILDDDAKFYVVNDAAAQIAHSGMTAQVPSGAASTLA